MKALDAFYLSTVSQRDLKHSATFFSKICMRIWIRSLSNPNTLTRMPPTQYPLSGKAAPPPNSRDAFPSLQQGADPLGWTQGDPREPQGAQGYRRAPSAPLGGMGPRGPLGLYRSHSEWNPVSTGRYLRREGHSFRKKAVRMERPFRMDGSSEWKAVPCVHTAAKTPNRMSADLVGF